MKTNFNTLYNLFQSHFPDSDLFETKVNFLEENNFPAIELLVIDIQRYFQSKPIDIYVSFELSFLQDFILLKKKYSDPLSIDFINYLQLSTFTNSMGFFNIKGLFSYTYDSIIYSVNDYKLEMGEELIIYDNRFWKFLTSSNNHIRNNSTSLIIHWLSQFYYCSFSSGALAKFGFDFWKAAKGIAMDSSYFDTDKLHLISNLISWNSQYKIEKDFDFSDFLIAEYNKLDWSVDLKIELCSQLILLKRVSVKQRRKWYYNLQKEVELIGHQELQLLIGTIDNLKDFYKSFKLILRAVDKYNVFLKSQNTNKIILAYERARIFKILNDLLILLGKRGQTSPLTRIISKFYGINSNENSILFIFPYFEEGIVYSCNGKVKVHEQDSFKLAKELIQLSNQLFNRTVALIGDKEDIFLPKHIMGKPSIDYAYLFEEKATKLYNFEIVDKVFKKHVNGILQLGFNSNPVQALMLKNIGFTYPICSSFSKPYRERDKKKVLIWSFGSYTSYFEEVTLKYLCEEYEYDFDFVTPDDVNKNNFISCYKSSEYTTIWIASHGEHNNFEPHKSLINISEDETVTLEELVENEPEIEFSRLLVLNLCESGINSESGGFKGLGFGHQLVSRKQSIISHLWMVEPRIAMTFGILLAIGLIVYENDYFEAYNYAVSVILKGKDHVIYVLESEVGELEDVIERVKNLDNIDWNNILNWGSAAYYQ